MSPANTPSSEPAPAGGNDPAETLNSAFDGATDWDAVLDVLAQERIVLEPVPPRGARVHHDGSATALSKVLPDLRLAETEQRFGESLSDAVARRLATHGSAEPENLRAQARDSGSDANDGQGTHGTAGSGDAAGPAGNDLRLTQVFPIDVLDDFAEPMSLVERYQIVAQCEMMINELYSHLPLKRAMFAVDPVQELALVRQGLDSYEDDITLFRDIVEIFTRLHDLHTLFELPNPWRQMTAFLPFSIAEFWEDGVRGYCVNRIAPDQITDTFRPGVILTHWNGTPIARHVWAVGARSNGANPAAQIAQAISHMTVRPLMFVLPPEESWVTLTYIDAAGGVQEQRLAWQVSRIPPSPAAAAAQPAAAGMSPELGVDGVGSAIKEANEWLFHPEVAEEERRCASQQQQMGTLSANMTAPAETKTWLPRQLDFAVLDTARGPVGYLRIKSFEVQNLDTFVAEVARILRLLPQTGLIIDLRGNPGGLIPAGEKILQFFTDNRIVPAPLEFRNSTIVRHMADNVTWLQHYRRGANLSVSTGQVFTQGFGIMPEADANAIGRVYTGRSVLLIDALVYSTGDFFAAGYKDARVGTVVGVAPRTGAGGGNVWTYDLLQNMYRDVPSNPFPPLPRGASIRLAARRSTRVGVSAGLPVEGLGVEADEIYHPTYQDVMFGERGLMEFAAERIG